MKRVAMILSVVFALVFSLVVAQAEEGAPPAAPDKAAKVKAEKPAPPAATEVTITGKLTKEMKKMGKPGAEKEVAVYTLTDAQGTKYTVPAPKAPKAAKDAAAAVAPINLDDFVDKDVTLTGKAVTVPKRGGKEGETVTMLKQVDSIVAAAAK
jgi:hypothetical protein